MSGWFPYVIGFVLGVVLALVLAFVVFGFMGGRLRA